MPPIFPPSEIDTPSDAELLAAWSCRDDTAFTAFFRRHAGLVYHTALRQGAATDAAAEVVQAVMTAAARKSAFLQKATNVPGWLHRATLLEMRRLRRHESREARRRESLAIASTMQTAPTLSGSDEIALQAEIDGALLRLSDKEQAYVFQRFYEGRSVKEIAAGSGETEAAVQKRGHRALERLANLLSRRRAVVSVPVVMATLSRGLQETAPAAILKYGPAAALRAAGTVSTAGGAQWFIAQAGAACLLVGGAIWQEQQIASPRPAPSVVSGVRPSAPPPASGVLTARRFQTPAAAFDPNDPDLAALAELCYRDSLGAADSVQHSRVFRLISGWFRPRGGGWAHLAKLYALNIPIAHRRELAARMLYLVQSNIPIPEKLDWTLRFHMQNDPPGQWHREFTKSIVSTLGIWAKENPEASWKWMQQQLESGSLNEAMGYYTTSASGPEEEGLAKLFDVVATAGKTALAEEILTAMNPKERAAALGTRLKSLALTNPALDSPDSLRCLTQIAALYGERQQDAAWSAAEGWLAKVSPQHAADMVIRFTNEHPLVAKYLIDEWAGAANSRKLTRDILLKDGMSRRDLDALMPPPAP